MGRRTHITESTLVGTYFARTTKSGSWQVGQWLPSGFLIITQSISSGDVANRIAQLLTQDRSSTAEWERLRVKTNEERIARERPYNE